MHGRRLRVLLFSLFGGKIIKDHDREAILVKEIVLRVATHNICHMGKNPFDRTELFPDGTYRNGYEADMVSLMKKNWDEVLGCFSFDLLGTQEYFPWFDLSHTMRTEDVVYAPKGYKVHDGGHGLALISKHPLEHLEEADFGAVSARRWQKFYTEIEGIRIAVFNTHPMPKAERREIRAREYAFLIEEFRKEPLFLAFGDFNAASPDEFDVFREAGFQMANPGLCTVENGHPCDNIIASPEIRLENVSLYDIDLRLSDHMVLACDAAIRSVTAR